MTNEISAAAHRLATAESDLAAAAGRHGEALAHVEVIRGRIRDAEARREAVRADHQAGELGAAEAGGLRAMIDDDLRDLAALLVEAEGAARAVEPAEAERAVELARAGVEHATARAEFDRLKAHVAAVEEVLVGALADLYERGQGVGLPRALSAAWRPCQALQRAVALGVAPTRGAA